MSKETKPKYYWAKMYKDKEINYELKVTMDDTYIYFVRNKDGVCAWHCGSLLKTDYRILGIRECND
ncbi:MAG: hypothetical protein GKR88_15910 [Flavobacteriaceae bacterium]|nr:MAG: hypothetical protein GKR88_15910 [Flavobacteriaceae bacterium]